MRDYSSICDLQTNDLDKGDDGKFRVVDMTRLCAPKCKGALELPEAPSGYQSLEIKCAKHEAIDLLGQRDNFISA